MKKHEKYKLRESNETCGNYAKDLLIMMVPFFKKFSVFWG